MHRMLMGVRTHFSS